MPISITSAQFLAVANAAAALCPSDRDQFIAAVTAEIARQAPVGDGSVGVAIRAVQSRFSHPAPEQAPPARWQREKPRFEKASKRSW
jgi:hypothetical protein